MECNSKPDLAFDFAPTLQKNPVNPLVLRLKLKTVCKVH